MWNNLQIWLDTLPPMRSPLERKQAPALQVFLVALAVAATLWIVLPLVAAGSMLGLLGGVIAALSVVAANLAGLWLLRRGRFQAAVLLSALSLILATTVVLWLWGIDTAGSLVIIYTVSLGLAGLLADWRYLLAIAALIATLVVALVVAETAAPALVGVAPLRGNPLIVTAGTLVLVVGVLSALYLRFGLAMRQLLQLTLTREQELEQLRVSLEATVQERTASLQTALHTVEQREAELRQSLADLRTNQDALRELSAPALPILPGVLVMPLVGVIDSARAEVLNEHALQATVQRSVRTVIFDITGVPVVDTQVAQVLTQTATSLRLLGAQVLIVGVRPEVAQTLVALNIGLDMFMVYATLQDAVLSLRPRGHARLS